MKTVWTIVKKEFARFFKDKRLVLSLLLPGVLIFLLYNLLGSVIGDKMTGGDDGNYKIYVLHTPESFAPAFDRLEETGKIVIETTDGQGVAALKEKIQAQKEGVDLLVEFPENFDPTGAGAKQTIIFTYNSARAKGVAAAELMETLIDGALSPVQIVRDDKVNEKDMTAMIFSSIAPMLLLTLLFSGCISIAPESIAGEKERGTLGAMLVTPVKRGHIALGKIFSLSTIALLSGACSFTGLVLSLPKLMQGSGMSLSAASYGFAEYAMMLGIVLSSVLVMVSAVSVVSALAKSVKEAAGFVGPLSLVPMLLGLSTMFTSGAGNVGLYFVPLYNSARALYSIFSFATSPLRVAITIVSNVVWTVALSVLLAKMFDSEKVMFNS